MSESNEQKEKIPELDKQNQKFGYKAPESVYKKHDPKESLTGQGKAFTGVSPSTCCAEAFLYSGCCLLLSLLSIVSMEDALVD
jgi:hypothetical protein